MFASKLSYTQLRHLYTSGINCGRRSRTPFDKRFPVLPRHVGPDVRGGSENAMEKFAYDECEPTGYVDPEHGKFIEVKEMIPEFVVPDLEGFELKPYVSYRVDEIHQDELTARALFNKTYAQTLTEKLKSKKYTSVNELLTDEEADKS